MEGKWLRLLSQEDELNTLSSDRRASHLFAFAAITANTGAGHRRRVGDRGGVWGLQVPQAEINCEDG